MMTAPPSLRLALAQVGPAAGDVDRAVALARRLRAEAAADGADLLVLPELFLAGGPSAAPMLDADRLEACRAGLEALAADTADGGPGLVVGSPTRQGDDLHDSAVLLDRGRIELTRHRAVPGGPFKPGPMPGPVPFRGVRLGVPIGDDLAHADVVECLVETGSDLLVSPAAWIFGPDSQDTMLQTAVARVVESDLALVLVNAAGGDGAVVWAGGSFALGSDRGLAVQLPMFESALGRAVLVRDGADRWSVEPGAIADTLEPDAALWQALVTAARGWVDAAGRQRLALDLSAPESLVAATVAVDALGADRVLGLMPDADSTRKAAVLAAALGIRVAPLPLPPVIDGLDRMLADGAAAPSGPALRNALLPVARAAALAAAAATHDALLVGGDCAHPGPHALFRPLAPADVARLAAWRSGSPTASTDASRTADPAPRPHPSPAPDGLRFAARHGAA